MERQLYKLEKQLFIFVEHKYIFWEMQLSLLCSIAALIQALPHIRQGHFQLNNWFFQEDFNVQVNKA